jgi:predicted nucleotidyltransferase
LLYDFGKGLRDCPRASSRIVEEEAAMHAEIAERKEELVALCRRYGVARLEVFGSAARGFDFDAAASDADFLVEFLGESQLPALEQFFGLADALEQLLGRRVDLIESGALRNPFILTGISRSRELVYAA